MYENKKRSVGQYDDKTICTWAKNKDSCAGDSGGPLVKVDGEKLVLVGLTSWGPEQCGNSNVSLSLSIYFQKYLY